MGFGAVERINALLKISNKSRFQILDMNTPGAQFEGEEKMVFRRGGEGRSIHGYFKIDQGSVSCLQTNQLINLFRKIEGAIKRQGMAFETFFIEANRELPLTPFEYKFF